MTMDVRDVYKYLVTSLGGDATLNGLGITSARVFSMIAPKTTNPPYIILTRLSGVHDETLGETEAMQIHNITVKAVTMGIDGGALARTIMNRVGIVITGQHPTISSGSVAKIRPKTDIEYIEAEAGNIQYFHVGTVYEFTLSM